MIHPLSALRSLRPLGRTLLILLALFLAGNVAMAGDKRTDKATQKLCKQQGKQLLKDGWQVYNSSQKLEEALIPYYEAVAAGAQGITAQQVAADVNTALRMAEHQAAKQLTAARGSTVKAENRTEAASTDGGQASKARTETAARVSSESRVKQFRPTVTLFRNTTDGKVEVMQYYLIPD